MRPILYRGVKRKLEAAGFFQVADRKPRKVCQDNQGRNTHCYVPKHHEVAPGALRSILRQARLSEEEFKLL